MRLSLLILTVLALKPRKIHVNNEQFDCLHADITHTPLFGTCAEPLESTVFSPMPCLLSCKCDLLTAFIIVMLVNNNMMCKVDKRANL